MKNTNKQKDENETRAKLFKFYENIREANQTFSFEELEIAIETLKLAQQNIKQNNLNNSKLESNKAKVNKSSTTSLKPNSTDTSKKKTNRSGRVLKLPNYEWFVSAQGGKSTGNIFTGSYRKDATKGHFTTTTFNYKVWVSNLGKENEKIVVDCFIQLPWWKCGLRENLSRSEYECSPSGLKKATEQLDRELRKFMEDTNHNKVK